MLVLQHVQLQISLTLIPLDAGKDEPVPQFAVLDKKTVTLKDAQIFIPDWLDLHWTRALS